MKNVPVLRPQQTRLGPGPQNFSLSRTPREAPEGSDSPFPSGATLSYAVPDPAVSDGKFGQELLGVWEGLSLRYDGLQGAYFLGDEEISPKEALAFVMVRLRNRGLSYGKEDVKDWLLIAERRSRVEGLNRLKVSVAYRPSRADESLAAVRRLVRAVTNAEDDVDVAAVQHFVWQVKRKLNGLPTEQQLFLVLDGPPRIGKSTAIGRLLAPVAGVCQPVPEISMLHDPKRRSSLTRKYVLRAEEMGKLDQADSAILKNSLTEDRINYREHYVNDDQSGANRATWIGSINQPLSTIISDAALAARFYVLSASATLLTNHDAINALDVLALWQGVDENSPSPIMPHIAELRRRQDGYRQQTPFEAWLDQYQVKASSDGTTLSLADLFTHFKACCFDANVRNVPTRQTFSAQLKDAQFEKVKRNDGVHFKVVLPDLEKV